MSLKTEDLHSKIIEDKSLIGTEVDISHTRLFCMSAEGVFNPFDFDDLGADTVDVNGETYDVVWIDQ